MSTTEGGSFNIPDLRDSIQSTVVVKSSSNENISNPYIQKVFAKNALKLSGKRSYTRTEKYKKAVQNASHPYHF
jgi:hypothetical protein